MGADSEEKPILDSWAASFPLNEGDKDCMGVLVLQLSSRIMQGGAASRKATYSFSLVCEPLVPHAASQS